MKGKSTVVQFLKAATVDGKRYALGQIVELDYETAHKLIASGIAMQRGSEPGEPVTDDEGGER